MTALEENCIFCDLISRKREASKVWEDDLVIAVMDTQPVNPGHVLVLPKKHVELIVDLKDEVTAQVFSIANKINKAIRKSGLRCEGINYFLADGEAAMQEIFHAHLHVFPRFENDGFGLKFGDSYSKKPIREELNEAADKIKGCL